METLFVVLFAIGCIFYLIGKFYLGYLDVASKRAAIQIAKNTERLRK